MEESLKGSKNNRAEEIKAQLEQMNASDEETRKELREAREALAKLVGGDTKTETQETILPQAEVITPIEERAVMSEPTLPPPEPQKATPVPEKPAITNRRTKKEFSTNIEQSKKFVVDALRKIGKNEKDKKILLRELNALKNNEKGSDKSEKRKAEIRKELKEIESHNELVLMMLGDTVSDLHTAGVKDNEIPQPIEYAKQKNMAFGYWLALYQKRKKKLEGSTTTQKQPTQYRVPVEYWKNKKDAEELKKRSVPEVEVKTEEDQEEKVEVPTLPPLPETTEELEKLGFVGFKEVPEGDKKLEEEIKKEVEQLTPEEKEKLGWGLKVWGFRVEKFKNDLLATVFSQNEKFFDHREKAGTTSVKDKEGKIYDDRQLLEVDTGNTLYRFFRNLKENFQKDAKKAENQALVAQKETSLGGVRNFYLLGKNAFKIGRLISDFGTIPPRLAMITAMVTARTGEAGKEARFANQKLIEKTRLEGEEAWEEAWAIYNNAKSVSPDGKVSTKDLNQSCLEQMPESIMKRLEKPGVASNFMKRGISKLISLDVGKLQYSLNEIDSRDFSLEEKRLAKQKELKNYESRLKDYDRAIDQAGGIDNWAATAFAVEKAGKAAVGYLTVETMYLSAQKVVGWASDLYAHADFNDLGKIKLWGADDRGGRYFEAKAGGQPQDWKTPLRGPNPENHLGKDITLHNEEGQGKVFMDHRVEKPSHLDGTIPENTGGLTVNPDAIVHKGEGIEHAFIRQIEHNPQIAQELGFKGDINDAKALKIFAQQQAHRLAIDEGYVDPTTGKEIRVRGPGDQVAYEITMEGDKMVIDERMVDGGATRETQYKGDGFETDKEDYEYEHNKPTGGAKAGESIKETAAPTETTPSDATPGESKQEIHNATKDWTTKQRKNIYGGLGKLQEAIDNPAQAHQEHVGRVRSKIIEHYDSHYEKGSHAPQAQEGGGWVNPYRPPLNYPDASRPEFWGHGQGGGHGQMEIPHEQVSKMIEEVSETNFSHVFSEDQIGIWKEHHLDGAKELFKTSPKDVEQDLKGLYKYLHFLQKETRISPTGRGFWTGRKPENIEQYIVRVFSSVDPRDLEKLKYK